MKYCDKCKVNVAGSREKCPLCQCKLDAFNDVDNVDKFPNVSKIRSGTDFVWRILLIISIIIVLISITVNSQIPVSGSWCQFVVAGVISLWIVAFVVMKKYKNVLKCLFYEAVVVSIICVIWDYFTGMNEWSFSFVLPCLFSGSIISMGIVAKALKICAEDYILYLLSLAVFGIVSGIFLVWNFVSVTLPTMICIGISLTFFIGLIVFEGKNMWLEFKRRLHF